MSVAFYRESPEKFDSRTLNRYYTIGVLAQLLAREGAGDVPIGAAHGRAEPGIYLEYTIVIPNV